MHHSRPIQTSSRILTKSTHPQINNMVTPTMNYPFPPNTWSGNKLLEMNSAINKCKRKQRLGFACDLYKNQKKTTKPLKGPEKRPLKKKKNESSWSPKALGKALNLRVCQVSIHLPVVDDESDERRPFGRFPRLRFGVVGRRRFFWRERNFKEELTVQTVLISFWYKF